MLHLVKKITAAIAASVCIIAAVPPFPNAAAADDVETELLYQDIPVTELKVSNLLPQADSDLDYTDWWYSEWDDCRYIFLPSAADRSDLVISYDAGGETLSLNGTPVISDENTSVLAASDEFSVTVGDTDCGTLKVMQSNTGCIFLNTKTGGLDTLDKFGRAFDESGDIIITGSDGSIEYQGGLKKISQHGNSSWDYSKKKSYNIKFDKKQDLFGLGKAKKWCLISNYLDHSMLRNAVTAEISRNAGMETMDYVFVDLYAGGSYRGTYQLSERVQIQKNRIDITDLEEETEKLNENDLDTYTQCFEGTDKADSYIENSCKYYDIPNDPADITGGYLLQFQLWNRYGYKCQSGFVTSRGLAVQVESPEYASEAQVKYIRDFVQDLEDAIYSDSGFNSKGKHYSDYLDVDSFVKAYIIQEFTQNADSEDTSFFLWKDSDRTGDGKLHCSPVWDFDFAYGTFAKITENSDGDKGYNWNFDGLFAAYFPISGYINNPNFNSGRPTLGINWIGKLLKRQGFVKQVAKQYFNCFDEYISLMSDDDAPLIMDIAESIKPSAEMNNARWHTYGGAKYCVFGSMSGDDFLGSVELVRKYMIGRRKWLSDYWDDSLVPDIGDVDLDGCVNPVDSTLILRQYTSAASGQQLLSDDEILIADVNGDGVVNPVDATLTLRFYTFNASRGSSLTFDEFLIADSYDVFSK